MDIDLHRQLTSGSNYRTHLAFYGGRVVAVKVQWSSRQAGKRILILFGDLLIVTLAVLEAQSYIG